MSASDPPLDPRGVRFAAALTTTVLAVVLATGSGWLLTARAAVLALAAPALATVLLDAASGFCPGCETHALIHRFLNRNQQGATA